MITYNICSTKQISEIYERTLYNFNINVYKLELGKYVLGISYDSSTLQSSLKVPFLIKVSFSGI